jgi:hypothetical protein
LQVNQQKLPLVREDGGRFVGMTRLFEKDGEEYLSMSGRWGATFPDAVTGDWTITWFGHLVIADGELGDDQDVEGDMRVGTTKWNINDLACEKLT